MERDRYDSFFWYLRKKGKYLKNNVMRPIRIDLIIYILIKRKESK